MSFNVFYFKIPNFYIYKFHFRLKLHQIFIILSIISLPHLSTPLKVDCSFGRSKDSHEYHFWDVLKHSYTCDGSVTVEADTNYVTKVTASHLEHQNNDKVHGLLIVHQRDLDAFPRGIHEFFKNLRGIDLEGCGLTAISARDLKHFPLLLQISLDDNKIVELPHDLFTHNPKIQRIDLEGNPLLHIGSTIFKPLPELKSVYLRHATCTSENSLALNRQELKNLEWEILIECPATFEMNLHAFLASEEFAKKVRQIIHLEEN